MLGAWSMKRGYSATRSAYEAVLAIFVRAANGVITTFDASGAGTNTRPISINAAGAITGWYIDASSIYHGFVRAADSTITSFDPPGSQATYANSINTAGVIAGNYEDASLFQGGMGTGR
jgi:hypothetical protein